MLWRSPTIVQGGLGLKTFKYSISVRVKDGSGCYPSLLQLEEEGASFLELSSYSSSSGSNLKPLASNVATLVDVSSNAYF